MRRRRSVDLRIGTVQVLTALLLIVALPSAASAQERGALAGRLIDAATGLPLAGIEVQALSYGSDRLVEASAVTDAAGRYRIGGLFTVNPYLVRVEHGTGGYLGQLYDRVPCWGELFFWERFENYYCASRFVDPGLVAIRPRRTAHGIDFALERAGSISGTVTAAATGAPLAGAEVVLWLDLGPPDGVAFRAIVETDAAGGYHFPLLPPGEYRLATIAVAGVTDQAWPGVHCPYNACRPEFGEPVPLALGEHLTGIDFALAPLGAIAGRVTAAAGGAPIAGIGVSAYDPLFAVRGSGVSDAAGDYAIQGLPPGEYTLLARDQDFVDQLYDGVPCVADSGFGCDPASGVPVPVAVAATTGGVDFALVAGGSIAGRVTARGEPVVGLELLVYDAELRLPAVVVTGPDGRYRAGGLSAGTYFVFTSRAAARGFADEAYADVACEHVAACRGRETPIEVAAGLAVDGVDFDLEPLGTIAGRVTAAATGAPIAGVPVLIHGGADRLFHAGLTDRQGRYRSPLLPRGGYTVSTGGNLQGSGFADQVYAGVQCPQGVGFTCGADEGTPVEVRAGEETAGIDFALVAGHEFHCVPSASGACVGGDRFRVSVAWSTQRAQGFGRPLPLGGEAAAFWFFAPDNPEAAVRVVDDCAVAGRVRVIATGLTDLTAYVTVFDGRTNLAWSHLNEPGTPFPQVVDHNALPCPTPVAGAAASPAWAPAAGAAPSPAPAPAAGLAGGGAVPDPVTAVPSGQQLAPAPAEQSTDSCLPGPTRLCLHGGRFAVEAEWTPPAGSPSAAHAVPFGERSGWFWFAGPRHPALLVKMLDGCRGDRPGYWFFAGGLTDQGVRLQVTDLETQASREYLNPPGLRFEPVQDTEAFPCP